MADAIKASNRQYILLAMATINVIYDYLKRRRHYKHCTYMYYYRYCILKGS